MTTRLVFLLAVVFVPVTSYAQPVLTFEHLGDRLNAGDRVTIVDAAGRTHAGPVATFDREVVALARGGGATERFARADVREVWMRHRDPVKNGVLIGFAATGASYCALAVSWGNAVGCGIPALFVGGIGAGIGALADAASTRQAIVFRAAAPVTWQVRPAAGGITAGATLRW